MNLKVKTQFEQQIIKKVKTDGDFISKLEQLNNKIDLVKKNLTYYDNVKITQYVNKEEDFDVKIIDLLPNEALIINSNHFIKNGTEYKKGDLIIKTVSGELTHIQAQSGGIFYPSSLKKDNQNYIMSYSYYAGLPLTGEKNANINEVIDTPYETISFNGLNSGNVENSFIYGINAKIEKGNLSYNFNRAVYEGVTVYPIIRYYNENEEIFIDAKVTLSGEIFTITLPNTLSIDLTVRIK